MKCVLKVLGETDAFLGAARGFNRVYPSDDVEARALMSLYGTWEPVFLEEFCFHALVPVPVAILSKGFHPAGFLWEEENWGTVYGAIGVQPRPIPDGCSFEFRTVDAPLAFFDRVSKLFPDLKFVLKFGKKTKKWG
jgi:hypothetical protein